MSLMASLPFTNGEEIGEIRSRKPTQSYRWKTTIVAAIASCFIIYPYARSHSIPTFRQASYLQKRHDPSLEYAGEKVSWEPCGEASGHPVECTNITVPMDHFNATNSKDKTFSIPLIRLRGGDDAKQNLLVNPGGPGGSGLSLIYRRGIELRGIVGDGFHLLSFDPRGVNQSTPPGICYPTQEARDKLSKVRDIETVHDSPEMYGWAKNFVQACRDTMGEHGLYLNTPQTAADMNSILDAVGQDDMYYWGFSYGTILGQTYAQLFPERSKRIVIDGVSNSFHWYGADFDKIHFTDTENVLGGFFSECIKAGDSCALSTLGDTKEELHKLLYDFSEGLKEQPISVYVNNTAWGLLDYKSLWYNGILPALYKPIKWYTLADNLAKLLKGNATDAWLAYVGSEAFNVGNEANEFVFNNDALSGPKYWPQDRETLLDVIIPIVNLSAFGASENLDYYTKQQWLLPRTTNFTPPKRIRTAHPLLIVSMTWDPICPLMSAKSTQKVFEGSQVVEIEGYGHCSVSVTSTCAAKHVKAFLYNGTVPNEYTKCEVDGPYFIDPEEDSKVVARKALESAEESIHRAQLALARSWEWKVRRGGLPMPL